MEHAPPAMSNTAMLPTMMSTEQRATTAVWRAGATRSTRAALLSAPALLGWATVRMSSLGQAAGLEGGVSDEASSTPAHDTA